MKTIVRLRTFGAPLLLIVVLLTFVSAGTVQATPISASTSYAKSWHVVSSPNTSATINTLKSVAAFSNDDVWTVGQAQFSSSSGPLVEHWNGAAWSIVQTPSSGPASAFNAVATIPGTHKLWAVGTQFNTQLGEQPLAELWKGTKWTVIPTPVLKSAIEVTTNVFNGVYALSATDAWAVGYYFQNNSLPQQALIEHWNGKQWNQIPVAYPSGSQSSFLYSVTAFSATNVWTVGEYSNGTADFTLVEHWNGKKWSLVSAPNPGHNSNVLSSVTRIPHTNHLWAVGLQFNGTQPQSLIEYWNGTAWSLVSAPLIGVGSQLSGVIALSAKSVWVVGSYIPPQGGDLTLTEHWNGSAWNVVSSPNPTTISFLAGLVRVPHSGILWTVGFSTNSQGTGVEQTLTEQYGQVREYIMK